MSNHSSVSNTKIQEQIHHLENMLENSPEDFELGLQLGQLYMISKQSDKAKQLFRKILDRANLGDYKEVTAYCMSNLGAIGLIESNNQEAKNWLSSALQVSENLENPRLIGQIYYHLAVTHLNDGERQQAIDLLERSADFLPDSPFIYGTLAEICDSGEKGNAYHHYAQGLSFELNQDYLSASDEFEEAIRLGLNNTEVYRRYGICLSELDQYSKAIATLKKSIELDSSNAFSYADLAFIYHKLNMEHMAAIEYEKAVIVAPHILRFYLQLIETYLQLDQLTTAQIWAERALAVDDTDATLYWFQGRIFLRQGRLLDSQNAWMKGLELEPDERIREILGKNLKDLLAQIAPSTIEQRAYAIEQLSKIPPNPQNGEFGGIIDSLEAIKKHDPYFVDVQMMLAQNYLDGGRVDDAKQEYERIVTEYPENQEAWLGLGVAFRVLASVEEAKDALVKAKSLNPHSEAGKDASFQLTILDVKERFGNLPAEKFEKAMERFNRRIGELQTIIDEMSEAVAMAPETGLFHFELGWMYLLSEQLGSATRQFKMAIDAEPDEGRFYGGLGLVLLKQGQPKEALPILLKATDLDPLDIESHNALGACYLSLDDFFSAEAEFRKVIEMDPYREEGWSNLRELLFKQNKFGQVAVELQTLLQSVPDAEFAEEAEQLLSNILEVTDEFLAHQEEPDGSTGEAILRPPSKVARLCQEGRLLQNIGNLDSAISKYQEAVAEKFDSFEPHFLLANIYARKNQHPEAIKEYSLAVSMETTDSDLADAYYNMGNSYRDIENFDQAIIVYRKAIMTDPEMLDARGNMGICLVAQEKFEEAIQMLKEELEIRSQRGYPYISEIHFTLGKIYMSMEKDIEALFEFQKGMIGSPNFAGLHLLSGTLFTSRGFLNLAQSEYEKELEIEPGDRLARSAVKALRFIGYDLPWMLEEENPRVKHSLSWHNKKIRESYPSVLEKIEIVHLGEGKYEKRRK